MLCTTEHNNVVLEVYIFWRILWYPIILITYTINMHIQIIKLNRTTKIHVQCSGSDIYFGWDLYKMKILMVDKVIFHDTDRF